MRKQQLISKYVCDYIVLDPSKKLRTLGTQISKPTGICSSIESQIDVIQYLRLLLRCEEDRSLEEDERSLSLEEEDHFELLLRSKKMGKTKIDKHTAAINPQDKTTANRHVTNLIPEMINPTPSHRVHF